jgi:hypothetical protein
MSFDGNEKYSKLEYQKLTPPPWSGSEVVNN